MMTRAESALFGTPDEIMRKLDALRKRGVEYVIIKLRRLSR